MAENNIRKTIFALETARNTFKLDEAAEFLSTSFPIRKIDEVLWAVIDAKANGSEAQKIVIERDLRRKIGTAIVGRWLSGNAGAISRDKAIEVAYALQMPPEEAEAFLKRCWHDGFYMRDIKDVIYVFGLEHGAKEGWSYEELTAMRDKLLEAYKHLDKDNPDPEDSALEDRATVFLEDQFEKTVETPEDLENFIQQNQGLFGSFRRKAYERFKELYGQIKAHWEHTAYIQHKNDKYDHEATESAPDAIDMSELCDVIGKGLPDLRQRGQDFGAMIRNRIAENIPTRTAMSEIINKYERKGQIAQVVDRKLLMLAWLASDDGKMEEFDTGNPADDAGEHIETINRLLRSHGMADLDPRHPFDWIVMNSLYYAYLQDEDTEYRIQDLVEKMRGIEAVDWEGETP